MTLRMKHCGDPLCDFEYCVFASPTWSEAITDWQEHTFGPVTPERAWKRFIEEFSELQKAGVEHLSNADVADEAADVVITFAAWVKARTGLDLAEAVERKMAINRAREWRLDGTGCGYHVKPEAADHSATVRARRDGVE